MKQVSKAIRNYADDILFIAGMALILVGAYRVLPVSAWFVAGVECIVYGVMVARSHRK